MMATKPKPVVSEAKTVPATAPLATSLSSSNVAAIIPETTEEREDALKQRLAALGQGTIDDVEDDTKERSEIVEEKNVTITKHPPDSSSAPKEKANPTPATTTTTTTTTTNTAPNKNDKSALLARIMAAQERAKQAQQQQKKAPVVAPKPPPEPVVVEKPIVKEESAMNAKQKILDALSEPNVKEDEEEQQPEIDLMNDFAILPPKDTASLPPPSFDAVEHVILNNNTTTTAPVAPPSMAPPMMAAPPMMMAEPSAPVFEDPTKLNSSNHLQDVVPLAPQMMQPPQSMAPPSFADYEKQQSTDKLGALMQKMNAAGTTTTTDDSSEMMMMQLDLEGNPISPEERSRMMEEQRAIMEQIQKEKQANDAAIAAARADNFEQRSAAGAAASGSTAPTVVEQSQPLIPMENGRSQNVIAETSRTVDIGGGQRVALQGQERTKAAIASGTALIVQCFNCNNWMQVTPTATLMYCPVCSTVSPVIAQTDVNTKDEAIQMMKDRQLAEQLQNMEYESNNSRTSSNTAAAAASSSREESKENTGVSGWLSSFTSSAPATRASNTNSDFQSTFNQQQQEQKKAASSASWLDSFTSVFAGNTSESNAAAASRSAEVQVTRPPGSSTKPRTLQEARTGHELDKANYFPESERLISSNSNPKGLQPARVAEKATNPFSCVVDTVNSFGNTLTTATRPDGGNVNGINSSPLLAVPTIGRNTNSNNSGGGDYQRVPNGP